MATDPHSTSSAAPPPNPRTGPTSSLTTDAAPGVDPKFDRKFTPVATMVLMLGYIIIFALLWGSVYFFELLARR